MNITNRTTNLIDLTKSKSIIIKLPTESRDFDGATTKKGNGPVNAGGMSSGADISGGFYGAGTYGGAAYGESLETFGKFIESFKEYDSALVECIHKGFTRIFKGS